MPWIVTPYAENNPPLLGDAASPGPTAIHRTPIVVTESPPWMPWLAAASAVVALTAVALAWNTRGTQQSLERELVRRQSDAQTQVVEARALARAAEEAARDAQAKSALLEARVAENTAQRSQLETLMLSLSKSRDENVLGEMEALLRAASAQSTWTGRSEPLMAALRQADERLSAMQSPRLAAVRKALARDLDRLGSAGVVDAATLAQRIDEVLRQADDLPLTIQTPSASAQEAVRKASKGVAASAPAVAAAPAAPSKAASGAAAVARANKAAPTNTSPAVLAGPELPTPSWRDQLVAAWNAWRGDVADEARALVRITRIDQPGAMLLAPEQAYFARENLKLRLLSARLGLLSRQTDLAQGDLREAQKLIDAYFDRQSKRVVTVSEAIQQITAASKQSAMPRPDETLAALATLGKLK